EHYAIRHKTDDAGGLAWLVIGYAHLLDNQHAAAIAPLKRASKQAGELGDYVDYYLGAAYAGSGDPEDAIATLRDFHEKYPDSLLRNDALGVYANALLAANKPEEAIAAIEQKRKGMHSDVELALGRAYAAAGQPARAVQVFRKLYFTTPLSPDATEAGNELKGLSVLAGIPPATFAERKTRAELLVQGHRYSDATEEYRELVAQAPPEEQRAMQVGLANALYRSGRSREAREVLQSMEPGNDDASAMRSFLLLEVARPDEARVEELLSAMRASTPESPWFQEALLSAGNMYLLKPDLQRAASLYFELHQRFPSGKYGAYAHWKAAWLNFRLGRKEDAKTLFEGQVQIYPESTQVVPALYWRARVAEDEHDYGKARAWYLKVVNRFRQYYYAELARERLKTLPADPPTEDDPVLARIAAPSKTEKLAPDADIPPDDLRGQKSLLLENGALYEQAVRELQAAAADGGMGWALTQMAHMYQEDGRYDRALQALKRVVPQYFAMDTDDLPRPVWEALFPKPYWDDLKRHSDSNQLDPFLVAALIRQESEFNATAVSRANAIGLMQLLPATGRKMAHEVHLKGYSVGMLAVPSTNLQLGTRYFHQLLDKFGGTVEYALAAYNAGSDRVDDWRASGNFHDTQEFVESIPFTETREYVQAIIRNASVYRRLYGAPQQTAASKQGPTT
ncbi:MAG: transglycosylase SLT domain-containing protein, partial [Acidobacteria bacterium]|nr:transglycosylase SLT domain-containing protein [Acidobacteriota bacterium]